MYHLSISDRLRENIKKLEGGITVVGSSGSWKD